MRRFLAALRSFFLSVMYFFLPPFSTNYSSIHSHLILPFISWSTSQSCCSQIHVKAKLKKINRLKWDPPVFVHIRLHCIHVYKQEPIKCLCWTDLYRHSPNYMTGTFWRMQCNLNFAQFRTEYTYCQLCMYKKTQQKSKLKHTRTWSAAAWPPCCPCYCPAVLCHHPQITACTFPQRKMWSTLQYVIINFFLLI